MGSTRSRILAPGNLQAERYDGIISYFAFIAGVSQADIKQFSETAHEWLKPGGTFVFATVPVVGKSQVIKWLNKDAVVSGLGVEDEHFLETFKPSAAEAGICKEDDVWPEDQLFVLCKRYG